MWFLNKNQKVDVMVIEISKDISIYAAYGSNRLKCILQEFVGSLEIEQFLIVYLEFNIFLLHIVDKLASNYYGNIQRGEIINKVVDSAERKFCETQTFDNIIPDKGAFFEEYFQDAFCSYPPLVSILGNNGNHVTIYFSKRLVDLLLSDNSEAQRNYMQILTTDILNDYITEFLVLKSIKQFKIIQAQKAGLL